MSVITQELPWNEGEDTMHRIMNVPRQDNPNTPFLTPQRAYMLQSSPLLAIGAVDDEGRPWATLWGGEAGFSRQIAPSIIGVRTTVDCGYDPVVQILYQGENNREIIREEGRGKMVAGLAIDLENRQRVKLFGRMMAGSLTKTEDDDDKANASIGETQLVAKIEQSLGNCPKYLNRRQIYPVIPEPGLAWDSEQLSPDSLNLIAKADIFFIASANPGVDMDCNHRGGPPGFVRVASNETSGAVLMWPEYSGNRLYQTLGNLQVSPKAGIVIPDFETGEVLYLTGTTSILVGEQAAAFLPRSNLAVRFQVTKARLVRRALSFRGIPLDHSPYNPSVRYLPTERSEPLTKQDSSEQSIEARLISKQRLTPTIYRYRYTLTSPTPLNRKPGQYIALSFRDELDMGYSHMRDDDPRSLNDDFVRTFTVSSPPSVAPDFELTIRKVGSITNWMSMQHERSGLTLPVLGFDGNFRVTTDDIPQGDVVTFVAAGIGITPLLPSLPDLDLQRLRLLWSIRSEDLNLVYDTFKRHSGLRERTTLFVSGPMTDVTGTEDIQIERRRITKDDLLTALAENEKIRSMRWYICTAPAMRKDLLEWLEGEEVVWEDFDY